MAARKRKSSEYNSDDGFVENDNDSSDRPAKRTRPTTPSTRLQPQTDSDGNIFWEISKMRRVTVSEYKGKQMVSVREYYEQNGEIKPGKKVRKEFKTVVVFRSDKHIQGISMPMDQYSTFVELLPLIERELVKKGEKVPRPRYNAQLKEEDFKEGDLSDVGDDNGAPKKSNIEATSDEDED
jgi:hypothetical protein